MLENLGATELVVVLIVVFLFFGPKKLPSLGRSLGRGMREFRKAMQGVGEDIRKDAPPR